VIPSLELVPVSLPACRANVVTVGAVGAGRRATSWAAQFWLVLEIVALWLPVLPAATWVESAPSVEGPVELVFATS